MLRSVSRNLFRAAAATSLSFCGVAVPGGTAQAADPCAASASLASLPSGSRLDVPASCLARGARLHVGKHDVPVPEPGTGVGSHDLAADGSDGSDLVVNNVDGVLQVSLDVEAITQDVVAAASPAACSDSTLSWQGLRNNGWGYYLKPRRAPCGDLVIDAPVRDQPRRGRSRDRRQRLRPGDRLRPVRHRHHQAGGARSSPPDAPVRTRSKGCSSTSSGTSSGLPTSMRPRTGTSR